MKTREALKAAVWPLHQATQRIGPLHRLMTRTATKEDYLGILSRMYGVVAPAEAAVAGMLSGVVAYDPPKRLPDLAVDLKHFGVSREEQAALPVMDVSAIVTGPDAAVGVRYLLEGSRRGGRILAEIAVDHLGLSSRAGAAFFGSAGQDVDVLWSRFQAALDDRVAAGGDPDAMVRGAVAGFTAINRWFDGTAPTLPV